MTRRQEDQHSDTKPFYDAWQCRDIVIETHPKGRIQIANCDIRLQQLRRGRSACLHDAPAAGLALPCQIAIRHSLVSDRPSDGHDRHILHMVFGGNPASES